MLVWVSQSTGQPVSWLVDQPVSWHINQSLSQPVGWHSNRSSIQSVSHSVGLKSSQLVSQMASQSFSQSTSQSDKAAKPPTKCATRLIHFLFDMVSSRYLISMTLLLVDLDTFFRVAGSHHGFSFLVDYCWTLQDVYCKVWSLMYCHKILYPSPENSKSHATISHFHFWMITHKFFKICTSWWLSKRKLYDWQVDEEGVQELRPSHIALDLQSHVVWLESQRLESILMHMSIIRFSFYAMVLLYNMYMNKILMKTTP